MKLYARGFAALALLCAAFAVPRAQAEVDVPPVARVTDLTGTLSGTQQQALQAKLAAFEQEKGSQIAVLILPTTQPETIEQYGIRVADVWKLGRKGVDDGAILLIAKDDRKLRIEVGYGLEGPLNDAISKRIISEVIVPRLRTGQWYQGIDDGIDQMIKVIDGEPLPPPPKRAQRSRGGDDAFGLLPVILIGGFIVVGVLRSVLGRVLGSVVSGGLLGFIVYVLTTQLLMALLAGFITFLFALPAGAFVRGFPGGGWGGGGWGGGGFGGGGFGGGSFGGGGGGFGGGGASGDW